MPKQLVPARRGWIRGIVLIGAVLLFWGVLWWQNAADCGARPAPPPTAATPVVSVTTATVRTGAAPVTLTGIGTVTPLKTVTVRSRVDGELTDVRFKEGQLVKAGDFLAQIDPRAFQAQLDQYKGQLAKDMALLDNAKADLSRYSSLVQKDMLAGQTRDTQASLVRQYEGAVRTDKAQIANAQLQIEYSRITAPISGRVGLRKLDPGNMVRAADDTGLLVITQVSPISVIFTLPEDQIPAVITRLRAGETLPVVAFDRTLTQKLAEGHLATTDNQIDTATGTIRLRAVFDNTDEALFPNQFVNAELLLETRNNVVLVPANAVLRGSKGSRVFVLGKDNTVTSRTVATGQSVGPDIVVDSGVTPGETVIVDGVDRLQDGSKVSVRKPAGSVVGQS